MICLFFYDSDYRADLSKSSTRFKTSVCLPLISEMFTLMFLGLF